jgi:putative transcriptional regulator
MNLVERELLEGMEGFLSDLKTGIPIEKKYTIRRVTLDLQSQPYRAEHVKALRRLLDASQSLFAQFLGVSVKTVRSWESGKPPSDIARRFMDEIRRDPDHWKKRFRSAIRINTA